MPGTIPNQASPGLQDSRAREIRDYLAQLLATPHFAAASRRGQLLSYLVEHTLAGDANEISEYGIGLEVFDRPPSFDPRIESLVRTEVSRLRQRLKNYYDGEGRNDRIAISLPPRTYAVSFHFRDVTTLPAPTAVPGPSKASTATGIPRWITAVAIAGIVLAGSALLALHFFVRRAPQVMISTPMPGEQFSVVLSSIANNTGDPVFDSTLREALSVELEQSPFLHVLSAARMQQSERRMGISPGKPLSPDQARDLCQRNASQAVIDGWIARQGSEYELVFRATNCRTGNPIADLETIAAEKALVLKALGDLSSQVRAKLGESLPTLQKFNTPIEDATTSSLDALQAYSEGKAEMVQKDAPAASVPLFERAVRFDPEFAIAWSALGNAYSNLGEDGLAADCNRRAYTLRQRVTALEQLYIEAHYYQLVTGDLIKARATYASWAHAYPGDLIPPTDLAVIDNDLGNYDDALRDALNVTHLAPNDAEAWANLANAYLSLDRVSQAQSVLDHAVSVNLDSSDRHLYLFDIAFLENDPSAMDREMRWAAGEPGIDDLFLVRYADALAATGHLTQARDYTARAVSTAQKSSEKQTAAGYYVDAAQREALFGNAAEARRLAQSALALANDRDTEYGAAMALALAGSYAQANGIADRLQKTFPDDTIVQFIDLPAIRAAVALGQKKPALALHALEPAVPYDFSQSSGALTAYLRGVAYFDAGDAARAQAQLEAVLNHPSIVMSSPVGPLAQLELGRAQHAQADLADARKSLQEFLARMRDADPGIPVVEAAKAEFASLQQSSEK